MALTRSDVEALIAASEKATEGPWEWIDGSHNEKGRIPGVCSFGGGQWYDYYPGEDPDENDIQLILASRNIMPELARDWLQKDAENRWLREVLNQAEGFISAMIAFYGRNLDVANWHMNGDTEPWDNFIDENGGHETLDAVRQALADIDAGSRADVEETK